MSENEKVKGNTLRSDEFNINDDIGYKKVLICNNFGDLTYRKIHIKTKLNGGIQLLRYIWKTQSEGGGYDYITRCNI
jgi:hypothetical protein